MTLLDGFRLWLAKRAGGGQNLTWPALILKLTAGGEKHDPSARHLDSNLRARAVATLFDSLDEFLAYRSPDKVT